MTEQATGSAYGQGILRSVGIAPVYTLTIGLSALLLFSVQPMFAKMVLPKLGGSPAVWSVAMVFFQSALLAGYAYAHMLTTRLTQRRAVLTHLAVMIFALVVSLPIGLTNLLGAPPESDATLWLLAVFAVSVGLPFFAISAHGPLLQAWFARSGHPDAANPYFLYAASNIGSLVALLSFPFLMEPLLSTKAQSTIWAFGFGLLIAAVALSAAFLPKIGQASASAETVSASSENAPSRAMCFTWCALAFVPSALLVAVTAHISTDIAAAPLLWVLPLALFLLTFIIVFQPKPWLSHNAMMVLLPGAAMALLVFGPLLQGVSVLTALALTLGTFFIAAMLFHGELVRLRPAAAHLTNFYLWMSFGGVLGGIFAGLIAPNVLNAVYEYAFLLALALVFRVKDAPRPAALSVLVCGAAIIAASALAFIFLRTAGTPAETAAVAIPFALGCIGLVAVIAFVRDPWKAALVVFPVIMFFDYSSKHTENTQTFRSFFGVNKVDHSHDGKFRQLMSGTTIHGAQRLDQFGAGVIPDPLTYFYKGGHFDIAIDTVRQTRGGKLDKVAIVGLGTGSQACLKQPGEAWSYYEIDPNVVKIASDPALFTFLSACAPDTRIVLGDARLKLQDAPAASYDMIIIDAFSSDSIPLHLVTREAIELYRSRLKEGGAIAFHISNRNLLLEPFVAATIASSGMTAIVNPKGDIGPELRAAGKSPVQLVVASPNAATTQNFLTANRGGEWKLAPQTGIRPWTDDFSDIISAAWMQVTSKGKAAH